MNFTTRKKITDIENRFTTLERFINRSKNLETEEKEQLIYSIDYILYIIIKLSINKGKL